MLKRNLWWVLILVAAGLVIYLLLKQSTGRSARPVQKVDLPPDVQLLIPAQWTPLQSKQCDYDGDGEQETLVIYSYNQTRIVAVATSTSSQTSEVPRHPIGGVIFDAQVSPPAAETSNQSPYRPTSLFPYRLLPDIYPNKGQGYLGETDVKIVLYPPTSSTKCQADEIQILGYSDGPLPTRVSVFRWQDGAAGYLVAHFLGNARVDTSTAVDGRQPITRVTTYNRLNDRSQLCESRTYTRPANSQALDFTEDPAAFTIDFCFKPPDDPFYPEGVAVAVLRGGSPAQPKSGTPTPIPPGSDYLFDNASVPAELALRGSGRAAYSILSFTNPAAVTITPTSGYACTAAELGADAANWWCAQGTATVTTEIVVSGQVRNAIWMLVSITPMTVNADVRWRVAAVTLQP